MDLGSRLSITGSGGVVTPADLRAFAAQHRAELPPALSTFYRTVGVGTLGGFLHFAGPQHMSTHQDLIADLIADDDRALIEPTADVIVFARSDNGDLCGWHAGTLGASDAPVVRLNGFDEAPLAGSTSRFLKGILDTDHFGIGPLAATYQLHDWLRQR